MSRKVLAIGAHPDDIEFMMAGTVLRLGEKGFEKHVFVLASGCCGSATVSKEQIVHIRFEEAQKAARTMGATFHPPITDDLEIFYELSLLKKVTAVVREVQPDIILTHSPDEYMEDHSNTCRLATSAVFARGMPNFSTNPPTKPYNQPVGLYHCLPYGLRDFMGIPVQADCFVDISGVMETKCQALACHQSQGAWLDSSQGLDSYINTMKDMCRTMGQMSGCFTWAEGWRRHNPLGFCPENYNPLLEVLEGYVHLT